MHARGLLPLLLLTAGGAHSAPPCFDPLVERVSLRLRRAPPPVRPALIPQGGVDALVLRSTAAELTLDWADADAVEGLLGATVAATRAAEPEHAAEILAVYTAAAVDRAPFYLPLGNDVRGIGYGRLDLAPGETFRSAVDPRLKGVAFLGGLPDALADPAGAEGLFLHEIGHRWGVYVHLGDGGDALLGRNCRHWSAFVDSGASPLEGHRWLPEGDAWRAQPPLAPLRYAPLTRYLMGLIPIEQVPPIERLAVDAPPCGEPARADVPNPRWTALRPGDAPWVVAAERIAQPADGVVVTEGPRAPAWPEAPTRWTVRFVVLAAPDDAVDAPSLAALRRRLTAAFMRAAGAPQTGAVLATGPDGQADVPPPDATVPDATVPDATVPDATVPDAAPGDLGPADALPNDGGVADRGPADAEALDARAGDGGRPDRVGGAGGCRQGPGGGVGWGWLVALGLRPRRRRGPRSAGETRPASQAAR